MKIDGRRRYAGAAKPTLGVRAAKDGHSGAHVLYWMTSSRRTSHNLALEHAVNLAVERNLPPRG